METVSVLHQPLRWAVTNGPYVVLVTYDRRFAERVLHSLKDQKEPHRHWVKINS